MRPRRTWEDTAFTMLWILWAVVLGTLTVYAFDHPEAWELTR